MTNTSPNQQQNTDEQAQLITSTQRQKLLHRLTELTIALQAALKLMGDRTRELKKEHLYNVLKKLSDTLDEVLNE